MEETVDRRQFKVLLNRNIFLPIAFGVITVIFFLGIISYLLSVAQRVERSDRIAADINSMMKLIVDQETGARGFILTGDEEYLQPYAQASELLPGKVRSLQQMFGNDASAQDRLENIVNTYTLWRDSIKGSIAQRGKNIPMSLAASKQRKYLLDQIRRQTDELLAEHLDLREQQITDARNFAVIFSVSFFLVSIFLSGILAHLGRRHMLILAASYENLLKNIDRKNSELQDEEWLRIGEIGLAEKIIGRLPLPILCQNILGYLAERIGVLVGAIYVNRDDAYFRREANYGFSKQYAQSEQRFGLREGLVGQAAAENRIIHLTEAPVDYLRVNSGLGESTPSHVLLVPIRADTSTIAVLELGFLRELEARDFIFLDRIADNIGAAIVAEMYRHRLHDMLREMQRLNENLQTQQRELQTAYEDLGAQSKVLELSQRELESQRSELQTVNRALQENNEVLRSTQVLLEQRAAQLEQASRYKSAFLANMSHELRTPLNSTLILSRLLANNEHKNLTDDQVRFAKAIHSAGTELLVLIDDVLDLSKVEAGKLKIAPGVVAIADIIERLRNIFEVAAAEKSLEFILTVAPDVPEKISTDRQRLEQILRNLLSNALKFTAQGGIALRVTKSLTDDIAFSVSDSGIGISAEEKIRIFEPFLQLDVLGNRKQSGVGLGLSISLELAHLLGGTIVVSSTVGKGSTFVLTIPARFTSKNTQSSSTGNLYENPVARDVSAADVVVDHATKLESHDESSCDDADTKEETIICCSDDSDESSGGKNSAAGVIEESPNNERKVKKTFSLDSDSFSHRTILIVDDDVRNIFALTSLLESKGATVAVGCDGRDAIDKLNRDPTIDLVLMDMMMPEMDGYEAIEKIRQDERFVDLPIIAITARATRDDREYCLKIGANDYIAKPADFDRLLSLIHTWLPEVHPL